MGPQEYEEVVDFGKKKKKSKKEKKDKEEKEEEEAGSNNLGYYPLEKGTAWSYEELLKRVHDTIRDMNSGFGLKDKFIVKPPQVVRVGSKRSGWVNFQEICGLIKRDPQHVLQYALAEFGAVGTLAGNGQLLLKGKFSCIFVLFCGKFLVVRIFISTRLPPKGEK